MRQTNSEDDAKRSKFLITAMILQIVVVLVAMFAYWAYLKS